MTAIYSGDTIALQTINRIEWMSFGGDSEPHTATCPKQYMEEVDYKSCTGEVFQIYRRKGEGIVRSGDFVGIYKPGENVWLGCPKSRIYTLPCFDKNFKPCRRDPKCFKATCPGEPNLKTGFSDKEDWNNCLGEVFKIYSRGKKDGNIITHRDDVILLQYATTRNVYVYEGSINNRYVYSCFDPPQDSSSFERCHNGVFNIWKQGLAE